MRVVWIFGAAALAAGCAELSYLSPTWELQRQAQLRERYAFKPYNQEATAEELVGADLELVLTFLDEPDNDRRDAEGRRLLRWTKEQQGPATGYSNHLETRDPSGAVVSRTTTQSDYPISFAETKTYVAGQGTYVTRQWAEGHDNIIGICHLDIEVTDGEITNAGFVDFLGSACGFFIDDLRDAGFES